MVYYILQRPPRLWAGGTIVPYCRIAPGFDTAFLINELEAQPDYGTAEKSWVCLTLQSDQCADAQLAHGHATEARNLSSLVFYQQRDADKSAPSIGDTTQLLAMVYGDIQTWRCASHL